MALRGRFEQPIVGLEATRVTIRIRSTLVGRARFDSLISPMSKNLYILIAWRKAGESNAKVPRARWFSKPAGIADIPYLPDRQLPIQ